MKKTQMNRGFCLYQLESTCICTYSIWIYSGIVNKLCIRQYGTVRLQYRLQVSIIPRAHFSAWRDPLVGLSASRGALSDPKMCIEYVLL